MKPTITCARHYDRNSLVYVLEIPGMWFVTARWPRLRMSWWLLRLVWKRGI